MRSRFHLRAALLEDAYIAMKTIVEKIGGIFKDEEKKGIEKQSSIFYRPIQDPFRSSSYSFSARNYPPGICGYRPETRFLHSDSNRKTVRFLIRNL